MNKLLPILIILFSLLLVPAIDSADALKSKGNPLLATHSDKVCGDQLCSTIGMSEPKMPQGQIIIPETEKTIDVDAEHTSLLFVQTAHSGTFMQKDGRNILTLVEVSSSTVWFTDRPQRVTGHELTELFIAKWAEGYDSFEDNPPNAVLDIYGGNDDGDVFILELFNPNYDPDSETLQYDVVILEEATQGLTHYTKDADTVLPQTFGAVALFIDDAGCGGGSSGTSMMMTFAGGLAAAASPIGGVLFDSIFPSGDDACVQELLDGMQQQLTNIDADIKDQTTILLGALTDMQFSLVESMKEESTDADLKRAREAMNTWQVNQKEYLNYLAHTDDSNDQKADKLEGYWGTDFQTNVISNLTDEDKLSQELRVEGFPLYWMGQLMFIAYYQDQAQLENPENPNDSANADNIKDIVSSMARQLDSTKKDDTESRLSNVGEVVCWPQGGRDITQYNIPLNGLEDDRGVPFQLDSFVFENITGYYCLYQDHLTDETYDGWTDKKYSLGANCFDDSFSAFDTHAEETAVKVTQGWILVPDYTFCEGREGNLYVLPNYGDSDNIFSSPETEQQLEDRFNVERDALISKLNDEIDEKYEPYDDAMTDLDHLKDTPVPNT